MLIAELQGKLSTTIAEKEDILTSNVFSFFKYSDRKFLFQYLNSLGINITLEDATDAVFEFWPNYNDGTQPDLVISCGAYYIILEAKLYSDYSERIIDQETKTTEKQLEREALSGSEMAKLSGKVPLLIAITSEPYQYKEKYAFTKMMNVRFIWTNWQFLASFLVNCIEKNNEKDLFLFDLYTLLVRKNLRSFRSLMEIFSQMNNHQVGQIFYNSATSEFRGEYSGYVESLKHYQPIGYFKSNFNHLFFQLKINNELKVPKTFFYHGNS